MRTLAVRAVRSVVGTVILLVAFPLLFAAAGLWTIAQHRGDGEAYTAVTERLRTSGYAVVAEDVDEILRADVPFARGGQTKLRVSAGGDGGPLFLGIGPRDAVRRYLAGTSYVRIDRVRPARGPLPVDTARVAGPGAPAGRPFEQTFWVATSTGLTRDGRIEDALSWTPAAVRGQRLAFVVMNADASSTIDVRLAVAMVPAWLVPALWGFLGFGGTLLILGVIALAWPAPPTRTVYVVEPARLRQLAAALASEGSRAGESRPGCPEAGREPAVAGPAQPDRRARRAGTRSWSQLFAAARPPATPRLLWPPKRAERTTNPPVPASIPRGPAPIPPVPASIMPISPPTIASAENDGDLDIAVRDTQCR